jgi:phospholipid/cholesterol/gamma-HCH transport system ATP-binding protein
MPYDRGLVFIAPATIFMSTPVTPNPASESAVSVPDALVELRGVTCGYGDRIILENIDLVVPRGKLVALMGTSGGGKTTVLRLIGRQIGVMAGQVLVDGQDMATLDAAGLMAARRRMGMLFQFGALFTDLSVFENVAFPLREHTRLPESIIRDLVLMKLNAVGLRGARDLMPSEVSGGMARRVALARAMALDPALMLYDEPFAGLDPISMGVAARLIRELNDTMGLTSILVSHDVEETFLIADHVVLLANGRIVAQGSPAEMRASDDPLVRQFVHAAPDGPVRFHYPAQDAGHDFGVRG